MGGKKKSTANKLAKMSDEERARYLAHRAEIEEEARRRKEQLIATFMKKKIKKEDVFSRLNLAKINQNWHQIMRKSKCKEMKENVDHMKKWMERVIEYKNRTISKLMEELEQAEEQYLNNYQCHSSHIDNILENQDQYINKLDEEYGKDLKDLLKSSNAKQEAITRYADNENKYLKTVLFGQETEASKLLRKEHDDYMQRCYETECGLQSKLQNLRKRMSDTSGEIWREISTVIDQYVKQTDKRRSHIAELKRLDAESAIEIEENQEKIQRQEDLIETLKETYNSSTSERQAEIKSLELEIQDLNKDFLESRRSLHLELQTDENKLKLLTEVSCSSLDHLQGIMQQGEQLKHLGSICMKYQTEREGLVKYLPVLKPAYLIEINGVKKDGKSGEGDAFRSPKDELTPTGELFKGESKLSPVDTRKLRPKTAIPGRAISETSTVMDTPTPEIKKITALDNITLQAKADEEPEETSSTSTPIILAEDFPEGESVINKCYESLKDLENFWMTYNKVEVNCLEIRNEKKVLEKENKQLRGMLRGILETVALDESVPQSKVSTRLPSRSRSAYSLPPRRVIF